MEGLVVATLFSKLRCLQAASGMGLSSLTSAGISLGRAAGAPTRGLHPSQAVVGALSHLAAPYARQSSGQGTGGSRRRTTAPPTAADAPRQHASFSAQPSGARAFAAGGQQLRAEPLAAAGEPPAAALGSAPLGPGCIVEFARGDAHVLGTVLSPAHRQAWHVEDAEGTLYAVRPGDVTLCLSRSEAAAAGGLAPLAEAAAGQPADATELLPLAWELAEPGALYSTEDLAELLFNSRGPAGVLRALRVLRSDRTRFRPAGRAPALLWGPRSAAQVDELTRAAAAEARATQEWALLTDALQAARAAPRAAKPDESAWLAGPHGARLADVAAFALGRGNLNARARGAALLQRLDLQPSPGEAASLLKAVGFWSPHLQLGLAAAGITERFEEELEALASQLLASPPADVDAERRGDLSLLSCVAIDDPGTTEIDDALGVEFVPGGRSAAKGMEAALLHAMTLLGEPFSPSAAGAAADADGFARLWVHVADPSRWVPAPGGALAAEARRRASTLYLPTGSVPMFPRALAEGPFSLLEGKPTPALSFGMVLNEDGSVCTERSVVLASTILPSQRMSYDQADALLDICTDDMEPAMFELARASELRRAWRASRGSTEIGLPKADVVVEAPSAAGAAALDAALGGPAARSGGDAGDVVYAAGWGAAGPGAVRVAIEPEGRPEASRSRLLVAEMMILAGEAAGILGARLGVPLPYRSQPQPVPPTEEEYGALPPGLSRDFLLRTRMLRSVTTAHAPSPHAGLGLGAYVQVTSPIRRYGDLLAHWQLKAALRGEAPPMAGGELAQEAEHLGGTLQGMAKLTREATSYWVAHYFRAARSADPGAAWDATLLGWVRQESGLGAVLLDDLGLETVARINRPASPGAPLRVRCVHADPEQGVFRLEDE